MANKFRITDDEKGSVSSVRGWEGFRAKNGKIYHKKKLAEKFGGGLA